jgi:uncharacterized protein YodC (DUF2158 family)
LVIAALKGTATMSAEESFFKIGDVVRLIGSDVNMTVTLVVLDNVYAMWFDTSNHLQHSAFKSQLLSKRRTS